MNARVTVILVWVVLASIAAPQWNKRRRYPISSWWRQDLEQNSHLDQTLLDRICPIANNHVERRQDGWGPQTDRGQICIKFHGALKILSWCRYTVNSFGGRTPVHPNAVWVGVGKVVVDARVSMFPPCNIYDLILKGHYYTEEERNQEFTFMLINGTLFCVSDEDLLPEYQTITLYPMISSYLDRVGVVYQICNTTGGTICPGPAKIPSIHDDEYIKDTGFQYGLWRD